MITKNTFYIAHDSSKWVSVIRTIEKLSHREAWHIDFFDKEIARTQGVTSSENIYNEYREARIMEILPHKLRGI
jgi:Uri superfamily endonuclease